MSTELIIIIDFGGQNSQLFARRIRENNVYCEVYSYETALANIKNKSPKGIILTGIPNDETVNIVKEIFETGIPILACIGFGFVKNYLDGNIDGLGELASYNTNVELKTPIFKNTANNISVTIKQKYKILQLPKDFISIAQTDDGLIIGIENTQKKIYALQFNPEISSDAYGNQIIRNFLFDVCNLSGDWNMENFTEDMITSLKNKIGNKKVLCALSGGVDSSVSAVLIHKAVGTQLTCIFVDHGFMRLNEGDEVMEEFSKFGLNIIRVNAQDRFLLKLQNISDPETKRKMIGEEFIRVFEEEAKKIGNVDFLVQGTIYPDIIESGTKGSVAVKSHHNVGGLPDVVNFEEIIEPLRDLFKDEVRKVGLVLNIRKDLVMRQPFPGPGLAVRVIGNLTKEKLDILRQTDFIFRDEIKKAGLDAKIWQYFTILTGIKSVGVTAFDERTYSYTVALRAVNSVDAMTATWYPIPHDILDTISKRIVSEVEHVNRIVYDITSKPPATIEWE